MGNDRYLIALLAFALFLYESKQIAFALAFCFSKLSQNKIKSKIDSIFESIPIRTTFI